MFLRACPPRGHHLISQVHYWRGWEGQDIASLSFFQNLSRKAPGRIKRELGGQVTELAEEVLSQAWLSASALPPSLKK